MTRAPGIRFVGILLLTLLSAGAATAQGPLLPTQPWMLHDPGPFTPTSKDWDNGNVQVTNPTGAGTITIHHFGVVWYPDDGTGNILPPASPILLWCSPTGGSSSPYIGANHRKPPISSSTWLRGDMWWRR